MVTHTKVPEGLPTQNSAAKEFCFAGISSPQIKIFSPQLVCAKTMESRSISSGPNVLSSRIKDSE